ncbi:MAG: hypothetical protein KY439_05310 [Actinobacteria bacterium]|nr:hypothetical protein [Actinomycetota bacterium]
MTIVLVTLGALSVIAALVEVAWTTVSARSGAGPLSARLGSGLWALALARHRARRRSRAPLSVAGVGVAFAVLP